MAGSSEDDVELSNKRKQKLMENTDYVVTRITLTLPTWTVFFISVLGADRASC